MRVVARVGSVHEAVELPRSLDPDVVVLDFHLDDGTGRDAAVAMRLTHPGARFMFLSRDVSDGARLAAIEAGASAYLHKSAPASEVIEAVRRVAAGTSLITPSMIAATLKRSSGREAVRDSLTAREREVLQLMSDGVPSREIAHQLGVGYSTIRSHVRSINSKLGAHSMLNAVVEARAMELVD